MVKFYVVEEVIKEIKSGMFVGIGTGPAVECLVKEMGRRLVGGELVDIWTVPCSKKWSFGLRNVEYHLPTLTTGG